MAKVESFPVEDKFEAKNVVRPLFDIYETTARKNRLLVSLDKLRNFREEGSNIQEAIAFDIGLSENKLVAEGEYPKFMFSGHRGSGKTTEIHRLREYLDSPDRFFTVLIEVESEMAFTKFRPQDFYAMMLTHLVENLKAHNIQINSPSLDSIAQDWLGDTENIEKSTSKSDQQLLSEIGAGIDLWSFLSLKASFKDIFSTGTEVSKIIRTKVSDNSGKLIAQMNQGFDDVRQALRENGTVGTELFFIFDGTEKIENDHYEKLFIRDAHLISRLDIPLFASVPISTFYNPRHGDIIKTNYKTLILPMLKVNEQSLPKLKQVVSRRISEDTFFEPGILDQCVKKSGGSVRQLLQIASRALNISKGEKITQKQFDFAIQFLGQEIRDTLTTQDVEFLKAGNYENADETTLKLLESLVILRYNGIRKLNPLLQGYSELIPDNG